MAFKRIILTINLLLVTASLLAQVRDSTRHKDTTDVPPVTIDIVKDTTQQVAKEPDHLHHSDYIINGKVEDMNTGEGIPFATVFFPHSPDGTATDLSGNFVMHLNKLPSDTLRVQALGYKAVDKRLRKEQHDYNYIIELDRASASLGEVVVHAGEDPAVVLMRHIIEHKPVNNPDKANNYKYQAYNRLEADLQRLSKSQFEKIPMLKSYSFVFNSLDTESESQPYLPMYLTETMSDYYFRREPKKQREFIKASMVKGVNNENVVKYLGSLYQNVNVYRNYIPVFDKKFISPLNDNALFYYRYTIKDTERAYGHNIILVQFTPRRASENCFTGDFWVVDSVYAIQRMSMDVSKLANINWVDRVSLYQEFAPVDSIWFCIKDKFIANFTIYNSNKLPGFIGRKTTTYHNIVVNNDSVERVLDDPKWKEDVIKLDGAKGKTDDWWAANRPDTLTRNEKAINKMVDTINKMPITTVYKNTITFLASGVKDIGPLQLGPYFYIYSHNPVEGNRFRISLGTPRKIKDAHITGFLAYGDLDKRFKYGFTGLWLLERHPRMYLYGYYIHDIDNATNYYDQLGSDNIFSALFRKPGIPWKLAFSDEQRLEYYKEYFSGFSHKLILQHRDYTPYSPLPYEGIFFDDKGNPSKDVVSSEVGVELRYAYKEKYLEGQYLRVDLGSKYPIVDLEVTAGVKNVINSAYNYQKARFAVTESINIPPLGHLYYNVFCGKYFGTLPYPLLEIHPGNEYEYYNQYAFEMMNTYEFISDEYAGINIEHNIGGGLFNYIPLLKRLKFRQFWTAKGVIGNLSSDNRELNFTGQYPFRTLAGDPYLELGTGVSNIFQIFRVDFDWRVSPPPQGGETLSRHFGVFGSVQFQF
jgi:Family of unknown function (DUF5686)/CarboxypepD_reg-like domain